ncbi:MAG: YHS domain-containing (seleno)protein [Litoreibacter sp.]|uniref:YHS domain-containing (seleno)protein n=1 Tax=Litoreibacter sp. TaxID=1969459 RepID=UPI003297EB80
MDLDRRLALGGIFALGTVGIGAYWAGYGRDTPGNSQYFSQGGVALRGADPVGYFKLGQSVMGTSHFSLTWAGVEWQFATSAHRDAFEADPMAYAPQYGGYCAWAVAEKGLLYSTQPKNWSVVQGKLYLNYDDGVQETWNSDRAGFIERGDERWPDVKRLLKLTAV